jgi:hypothetical protein
MHRDMARLRLIREQIKAIEKARLEHLKKAPRKGTHPMLLMLAQIMGMRIPIDAGRCFRREAGQDSGTKPDTIPTRSRTPFRIEAGHPQVMWAA